MDLIFDWLQLNPTKHEGAVPREPGNDTQIGGQCRGQPDALGNYTCRSDAASIEYERCCVHRVRRSGVLPQQVFEAIPVGLDRLQQNWLSGIAHDLRSSLFAARGYTRMVLEQRDAPLAAGHQQRLNSALDNLTALLSLIEELGNFPKVGALRLDRIDLGRLVEEASAGPRANAAARQIRLLLRTPPAGVLAFGDEERLCEAMRIVLAATVDFTCPHGIVDVRVREEEENVAVRLCSAAPRDGLADAPDIGAARQIFRLHAGAVTAGRTPSGSYQVTCELPALVRPSECK